MIVRGYRKCYEGEAQGIIRADRKNSLPRLRFLT